MRKKRNTWATVGLCALCVIVAAILLLNIFPSIAYAVDDVPVLAPIVRVLTFNRYAVKDDGYEANIVTPQIQGLLDEDLQNELNERFKENADILIAQFEEDVESLKEQFGEETVHYGVVSDYTVKTDNDEILAIDNFTYSVAGSSSTIHSFYTIDKKNGRLLTLEGLFEEGADYVAPISRYIKDEMSRLNDQEAGLFWISPQEEDGFDEIKPDQSFYINDRGELVISFDKYEVAAGAQGSPEFVIPYEIISDIVIFSGLR